MADKILIGNDELTEEEVNAGFALLGLCLITIPVIGIGFGASVVWNRREKKKLKKYIDTLEKEIQYRKNETTELENIKKADDEKILRYITKYRELRQENNEEANKAADSWIDGIESVVNPD